MTVYIKIEGIKELNNLLEKASVELSNNLKVSLNECGLILKDEIEASIAGERAEPRSVDTGAFLASIVSQPTINGVEISSDMPYAKFLEYGTSKIDERRHFRNSMDRITPVIKEKIVDTIKTTI